MKGEAGQSLVEVLIALMVVTLVLISIMQAVILGIRSAAFSQHKGRATGLAQEAVEWLRVERQAGGWQELAGYATGGGSEYCLDNLSEDFDLVMTNVGECQEAELIDNLYSRVVTLTVSETGEEINAEVVVSWFDGSKDFTSLVSTTFNKREEE